MSAKSPFLALPAELRLHIYAHVFSVRSISAAEETSQQASCADGVDGDISRCNGIEHAAGEVKVSISSTITSCRNGGASQRVGKHFAGLVQTCKLVHDEAVEVLHQRMLFRIALGAEGLESVDTKGRLRIQSRPRQVDREDEFEASPLPDLSLFHTMQNVHLDLKFGPQPNPIWDALPVIRAIVAELNPERKHTTASLRFGVMAAMTCTRLTEEPWRRFVREMKSIELGCVPDVEIDQDAKKWTQYGWQRFEDFRAEMGGDIEFVKFKERLGPHDDGLRACVIL